MLFSATQTRKVEDLARISLKKEPLYIGVDDKKDQATVDGLEQVSQQSLKLAISFSKFLAVYFKLVGTTLLQVITMLVKVAK